VVVATWWPEARGQHRRMAELGRLRPFGSCDRHELVTVARLLTRMDVTEGTTLVHEGQRGDEFFVIVSGRADVSVGGRYIASLSAGDFFGEIALLDHRRRTASVIAVTDLVVEVCSQIEFRSLLANCPDVTRRLLAGLAGRLRVVVAAGTGQASMGAGAAAPA
jgi:CRP/FNR family transcriptional regulator, cyclic AMP receptor protein